MTRGPRKAVEPSDRGGSACSRCCWSARPSRAPGIGDGVAIPHGKMAGLDRLVATFARSVEGCGLRIHRRPEHPPSSSSCWWCPNTPGGQYLKALARISRFFRDPDVPPASQRGRPHWTTILKCDRGRRREALSGERPWRSRPMERWWTCRGWECLLLGPSGASGRASVLWSSCDRGHRLVADDVVRIQLTEPADASGELVGTAPERHSPLSSRSAGFGILFVPDLFGAGCGGESGWSVDLDLSFRGPARHGVGTTSAWDSSARPDAARGVWRCPAVTVPARPGWQYRHRGRGGGP